MGIGESMMNWLRRVEPDQNLQGIGDLTSTSMSDRVRRWFRRQDLTPTLPTGWYDPISGRYTQGQGVGHRFMNAAYSTASSATATLDVPAGQVWRVVAFYTTNVTRAFGTTSAAVIGGTTVTEFTPVGLATITVTQGRWCAIVGGMSNGTSHISPPEVILDGDSGDQIVATDSTFVGGDNTAYFYVYERLR